MSFKLIFYSYFYFPKQKRMKLLSGVEGKSQIVFLARKRSSRETNWVNANSCEATKLLWSRNDSLLTAFCLRSRELGKWKHLYWIGKKFWWLWISELYSIKYLFAKDQFCSLNKIKCTKRLGNKIYVASWSINSKQPNSSWLIRNIMKQQFKVFKQANICELLQICITKHQWCALSRSHRFQFLPNPFSPRMEAKLKRFPYLPYLLVVLENSYRVESYNEIIKKFKKIYQSFFMSTWRHPFILLLDLCTRSQTKI